MTTGRRVLAGAALGAVFAVALILASSRGDVDRMTYGDGHFYLYVASHLDATPSTLIPTVAARGPALRYGRIGLPALVWLLSAGHPAAMSYAQPAAMVLCAAAIGAAAVLLLPRAPAPAALIPFVAVGLTLAISGGYVEPLAAAGCLWAIVLARRQLWVGSAAALAIAALSRESAVVVVVGLVVWALLQRDRRGATLLIASVLPALAWHAVVRARFGVWPVLDPYLAAGGDVSRVPFKSIASALLDGSWAVRFAAGGHLALGVWCVTQWRTSALGAAAAAASFQVAIVPALTWSYLGDTFRTFALLESTTVLLIAFIVMSRRPEESRT